MTNRSIATGLVALAALSMLTGCGGSEFGAEIATRPKTLAIEHESPETLTLPGQRGLSIHFSSAGEQIGLDGEAHGTAKAAPEGTAEARAEVKNAGNANGVFQLGQGFRNSSARQMDLDVDVKLSYGYELTIEGSPGRKDSSVGLMLYARDNRNRYLRKDTLIAQSSERGAAQRELTESYHFTVTLAPAEEVDVYVAGEARAVTKENHAAAAAIHVKSMELTVRTAPAPAVEKVTTTQPAVPKTDR